MVTMMDMLKELVLTVHLRHEHHRLPDAWSPEQWKVFIELARVHRISPLIAHRFSQGNITNLHPDALASFQKDLHKNRLFHKAAAGRLLEIEQTMHREGIAMVPLKGPRLSEQVYESTGVRPFEDLDFLVDPEHTAQASSLLTSLGYAPVTGKHSLRLLNHYHFHSQWVHASSGQCVELHWRAADRLSLPVTTDAEGQSFKDALLERPACYAVYLAIHLAKHGIFSDIIQGNTLNPLIALHPLCDVRLIWLLDIACMIRKHELEDTALLAEASRWNVTGAMQQALYLSQLISSTTPFESEIERTNEKQIPGWKKRCLNRIRSELDREPFIPDVPWWMRPGKRTGFRPVRILELFS